MVDLSSVPCNGVCISALCAVEACLSLCFTEVQQIASMPFLPFRVAACKTPLPYCLHGYAERQQHLPVVDVKVELQRFIHFLLPLPCSCLQKGLHRPSAESHSALWPPGAPQHQQHGAC